MLRRVIVLAVMLVGCADVHEDQSYRETVPPLLQRYAEKPDPGTVVAFPTVPLFRSLGSTDTENLLWNPGFEHGRESWSITGPKTAVCAATDLLRAEGQLSLQVLPSPMGDVYVSQTVTMIPRTFYTFSAFLFAPGASEAALEVQDGAGNTLLRGESSNGPLSAWAHMSLTFVTGIQTEAIWVGIHCSDRKENAPILIDQCALYALPAESFIRTGTMESPYGPARMAEWYHRGKSISPVPAGYQSEYALELPSLSTGVSSLVCLIPTRQSLEGRDVWVSAMIKSVSKSNTPPPEVTLALRLVDAFGERSEFSTTCPATGKWEETILLAATAEHMYRDTPDPPYFQKLCFERPPSVEGRVLIDEVVMLGIPEGRFDGGLVPATSAR